MSRGLVQSTHANPPNEEWPPKYFISPTLLVFAFASSGGVRSSTVIRSVNYNSWLAALALVGPDEVIQTASFLNEGDRLVNGPFVLVPILD